MTRTKSTYLALLTVLLSPMVANADVIKVNYTGEVTSTYGTGLGYAVGDTIMGWFEYDTDDLNYVDTDYYYGTGPVDSNTGDGGFANQNDYVYSCDVANCGNNQWYLFDFSYTNEYEEFYDELGNYLGFSETYEDFYHYIELYDGQSYGQISESSYTNGCDADNSCNYDENYFNYATFTFNIVAVPEPGTLALLGIGLLGMGLARRRKTA